MTKNLRIDEAMKARRGNFFINRSVMALSYAKTRLASTENTHTPPRVRVLSTNQTTMRPTGETLGI